MSVDELKAKLYDAFGLPTKHLSIFHNEKRIDLQLANLKMANFKDGLILVRF